MYANYFFESLQIVTEMILDKLQNVQKDFSIL